MKTNRLFLAILLLLAPFVHSVAEMQVSLLTCEPGTDVYELEGHTALRFRDTDSNTDYTVNWGLFDFNSPRFVYRFVKGETDYMCGAFPTARFLASYQHEGRRVTEQILNLTPEQVETLYRLVADNLRAENCSYRYKYLTDNCATRPLTLIEIAIGHKPEANPDSTTVTTWRNEMRHYHRNYPWYQFGIDLALGSRLDKKITSHDRTFAPIYLRDYLEDSGISGKPVELLPATDFGQPYGPTPWILTPMAAAIFILLITISVIALKKKWPTLYKVYTSLFYTLMALAGAVIVFLVVISEHEATTPNWLLLWLNPLTIIPAVAIWLKKLNRAVFYYQIVNFACLIVLLFIFAIGIQSPNPSFWPWMLSDIILATNYIWSNRCIANRHRS